MRESDRLVEQYLNFVEKIELRQKGTVTAKRHVLGAWVNFCEERGDNVFAPSLDVMADFCSRPRRDRNGGLKEPAKDRVRQDRSHLRTFYKWAHEHAEVLPKNFAAKLQSTKGSHADPKPIPLETFYSLPFLSLKDELVIALGLGWFCGLRAHEIGLLSCGAFDGDDLEVQRKMTAQGERLQRFPWQMTLNDLVDDHESRGFKAKRFADLWCQRWRSRVTEFPVSLRDSRYLIHRPKDMNDGVPDGDIPRATRRVNYLYDHAYGKDMPLRFTSHKLRHSFCTHMGRIRDPHRRPSTFELTALMNHGDAKTTMRYFDGMSSYRERRDDEHFEMSREVTKL